MTEDAPTVASQTAPLIVPPSGFLYTDACLIHIYPTGTLLGRRYALNRDPIMLGRGEECEICIQDSSVSRCHAYIEPTDSGYVISDRGSTNGTFVNDERIPGRTELRDGDSLRIGKCLYRYLAGGNIEAAYHEEIYRVMILDGLTQIHNRRYLNEFLDIELARSQRYSRPVSLLLFDIDRFKMVNDTYGHLCGDSVLREMAARLRCAVRKGELLARYGGEEFAIVLVETTLEQAILAAERIRSLVAGEPFDYEQRLHHVTISVGVASTYGDPDMTPASLIDLADRCLFRAKQTGRNRVVA